MIKNKKPIFVASVLVGSSCLLSACSLIPVYQRPVAPIPERWDAVESSVSRPSQSNSGSFEWKMFVGDAQLRKLIELALANNRDLRQAMLNVQAARAQYGLRRADRLPNIDLQAGGIRQRVPGDISPGDGSEIQNTWQAGVGLGAFEIDLFRRVASMSESAMQDYLSTQETARAAQITLVGDVIEAYISRNGAQQRRLLTEQTLRSRESSLRLISARRSVGVAAALDYQEAVGLAEQARAELERTDRQISQASNAIGLLVGDLGVVQSLPAVASNDVMIVQDVAPGLPSDLLSSRPDIEAAERRLRARNADIGAARAAFFPRITLTGMFGSSSADLSDLFSSGQRAWSFSPQIAVPIFSGGRNSANLDLSRVRKDLAIVDYERSIQIAFREVADALAATDTLRREEQAQAGLAYSGREAVRLSEARYKAGIDGHLRYLDAQRSAFTSQIALIQVTTERQLALANLFRTLGGGWGTLSATIGSE